MPGCAAVHLPVSNRRLVFNRASLISWFALAGLSIFCSLTLLQANFASGAPQIPQTSVSSGATDTTTGNKPAGKSGSEAAEKADAPRDAAIADLDEIRLAKEATISRDDYGVPHCSGPSVEAAVFALAYAQAEDDFWQIEDSYILGLGRYAEVHGPAGLNSDLLNAAFEVATRSEREFFDLEPEMQRLCAAYAYGLNYYLRVHPRVQPRLIRHFEPWHVIAFGRQLVLETTFRYTRLSNNIVPRTNERIWSESGSNGWAIGPSRTKAEDTILFANPHQPWFGYGQMCEVHLRCDNIGLNFIGGGLYGSPLPTLGHNDSLGWTLTTNEPDIADVWRETFDDPQAPLMYQVGNERLAATVWERNILVKYPFIGLQEQTHTFRKTVHGPIVQKEDETHYLAANIAGLHDTCRLRQLLRMMKAKTLSEFEAALDTNDFTLMNVIYADKHGNIGYYYTGAVPQRDPNFNWSEPVPGENPKTLWSNGKHAAKEFPRLVNPPIGYVQNCNSSPYTTTSDQNPLPTDYPPYMVEDAGDDRRRAKRSRQILDHAWAFDLDRVADLAFDTTSYWGVQQVEKLPTMFAEFAHHHPDDARRLKPYVDFLITWDGRVTVDSRQATLCEQWYSVMHGTDYPGETLLPEFADKPDAQLRALETAANHLEIEHGTWQVPWGDVFRAQRVPSEADFRLLTFNDDKPSIPSLGVPGQLGAVFTQYYTPYVHVPFIRNLDKRYGVVGTSYMAVWEFSHDGVRGKSLVQFGARSDANSPHYFDQARLLDQGTFKAEHFAAEDVAKAEQSRYHPANHDPRARTDAVSDATVTTDRTP